MATFKTLINIDSNLRAMFKEIEMYFSITLEVAAPEKIFKDADDDQVSQKEYLIYQGEKRLLRKPITIRGSVDEYEPSEIWIVIENIKNKDVEHFTALASD